MAEMKILTLHTNDPDQINIDTYEKNGGYQGIKKAIPHISPEDIKEEVLKSGLRGRGGAGFQTGKKWSFLPKDPNITKYLVCNCDESEPGTFKDRFIIEKDPHQLIEGIILSSYAIGAKMAFIYCRGEFFEGFKLLNKAISEAKEKKYLEHPLFGSDFTLKIIVHPGAGAYIAGEETSQLNSLEGFRATPRLRPPFPAVSGLYAKPTIVNNVETLCNVVHIVNRGSDWYTNIGKPNNTGTKIFQVSGHVNDPGCYEFPLGTPLSEVIERAGGILNNKKFKACYPGGSSCSLLNSSHINIPMDFESLAAAKSALGTASIIVMSEEADMVKVAHRLMEFYQNESCGKCTPCREGTRWVVQILSRILREEGTYGDLSQIEELCSSMESFSFCPLAVGAAPPIVSAIREFRHEFDAYIRRNPHADRAPKMNINYPYL